ncbi:MAG TPA: radical SAM protein [Longimicrobium sp.]|nr:radical SAM protein [Longimicrobium sp.]
MTMPIRHKVVLYNPAAVFFTMPLALIAIGSHLDPERYEVVIVDGRLEPDPAAAVLRHLPGALCVGMTVLTGAPIRDAVRVSRAVKAADPELPVIWGGWHPSMFGAECLAEPSVDVTVQGQGEATFAEIVERLAEGDSLEGCEGCTYRGLDGGVRRNPARAMADVKSFRPHDYGLIDFERYYGLKGKKQLDFITSQGCHFRCAFCADPFVYKRKWVGLDAERVGGEIEALWRRHRFDDVNFQDETFFTYADRVEGIAEELLRRGVRVTWAATMRADQCFRLSDRVFATCRRSGLRRVLVGVESGSDEMMKRIRKDITLEQVFYAAERCRAAGVAVIFPFIVGFPGETEESVQASLDVAKRLRAMSSDFETPFFYFKPYPGSAITLDAVRDGYRLPESLDEWADFDFIGSSGPWVTPEKHRRIERFKFYQGLGWSRGPAWLAPARRLARWRLRRDAYAFPIEKVVSERLRPAARLS